MVQIVLEMSLAENFTRLRLTDASRAKAFEPVRGGQLTKRTTYKKECEERH